jgi:pantetheine-phosphate adenylyltransferase
MLTGIYPGSFDPLTNGHLDIINRAASIFDNIIVAVAKNQAKRSIFTVEERVEMLNLCCSKYIKNVRVVSFDGLLVDYCKKKQDTVHSARITGYC